MERVLVIGCSGSGKSTFSRKLGKITGLPVIHLDQHFHGPNWEDMETKKWEGVVQDLISKDSWIIDGNYGGTLDMRSARADTVIFLDYPTAVCLWRITKRTLKYLGKVRPDAADGCKERFDLDFVHYVATFNLTRRKGLLARMDRLKSSKRVLIFKNDNEVRSFMQQLTT